VPAPDQSGLQDGELRFIVSLRAIGEGHLSSIEFRSGIIDSGGNVHVDTPSRFTTTGQRRDPLYPQEAFRLKLRALGVHDETAGLVLDPLPRRFTLEQFEAAITDLDERATDRAAAHEAVRIIRWLAASDYTIEFAAETQLSERVIFPSGPTESQGMEDARFVRFRNADGSLLYYATYTAFDGRQILPQLIETADFRTFDIATLSGRRGAQQGHGHLPAVGRRTVRGPVTTGQ